MNKAVQDILKFLSKVDNADAAMQLAQFTVRVLMNSLSVSTSLAPLLNAIGSSRSLFSLGKVVEELQRCAALGITKKASLSLDDMLPLIGSSSMLGFWATDHYTFLTCRPPSPNAARFLLIATLCKFCMDTKAYVRERRRIIEEEEEGEPEETVLGLSAAPSSTLLRNNFKKYITTTTKTACDAVLALEGTGAVQMPTSFVCCCGILSALLFIHSASCGEEEEEEEGEEEEVKKEVKN